MKTTKTKCSLLALIAGSTMLFTISCKDHNSIEKTELSQILSSSYESNIDYQGIRFEHGMLVFESHEQMKQIFEDLDNQWNDREHEFVTQYAYLDDEALNEFEEESGYNSELPYEEFEAHFPGFLSLRQDLFSRENDWLEELEVYSAENDPDNHFIIDDTYRALLNVDAEYAVNDTIFKEYDHLTLKIFGAGIDTLILVMDSIKNGGMNVDTIDGQAVMAVYGMNIPIWSSQNGWFSNTGGPGSNGLCNEDTRKRDRDKEKKGNYMIKWKLRLSNRQIHKTVTAVTKSYKKNRRGKWRKYRTAITAHGYGHLTDPVGCDQVPIDCGPQTYRAKKIKNKCGEGLATARRKAIKGYHSGGGGVFYHSELNW